MAILVEANAHLAPYFLCAMLTIIIVLIGEQGLSHMLEQPVSTRLWLGNSRALMLVFCRKYCFAMCVIVAFNLIGCSENDNQFAPDSADSELTTGISDNGPSGSKQEQKEIRPGFGNNQCYVGMPQSSLGSQWQLYPDLEEDYRFNRDEGLSIVLSADKVKMITFYYKNKDKLRFNGRTAEGIHSESKIEDVKSAYGEPSYTLKREQSEYGQFPGATEITIDYVEKGIEFIFIDDQLASISVLLPDQNFDYEEFGKYLGDSLLQIRKSASP